MALSRTKVGLAISKKLKALLLTIRFLLMKTRKFPNFMKITADKIVANEQSVIVEAEAKKCNEQATEAIFLKNSCEHDLVEAIPALEAAERALKSLKREDITEMKAMKKPSQAIKMTMAAVSVMMEVKPDKKCKDGDPRIDPYWGPASKELLNDAKFLNRLQDYDRDNMSPMVIAKATAFTEDPEFDPEVVSKKGVICSCWSREMGACYG